MKRLIVLPVLLMILISCDKDKANFTKETNCIKGAWVNPEYTDSTITFDYRYDLKKKDYGIKFNENGTLTERKNSGWCGTPPISYADYEGNWSEENSILNISVNYWGGIVEYEWKILLLNSNHLKVKPISENYNDR